jgi:hypothetical protein
MNGIKMKNGKEIGLLLKSTTINFITLIDYVNILSGETERDIFLTKKLKTQIRKNNQLEIKTLIPMLLSEMEDNLAIKQIKKQWLIDKKSDFKDIGMYHVYFKRG